MKKVMQGNEAIARGAWEAGATVAAGYPGTPSSEILQEIARSYGKDIYAEWSPNEKVAMEVGAGAAIAGARAMVCMKHVGLNVASDPFMTLAYTGIKGGFVIIVADDPNVHSSQNEQDSRNWARFAKVPMLEPGDAQECKDFTKLAFEISENFDTPVLVKGETRVSHSDSLVEVKDRKKGPVALGLDVTERAKLLPAHLAALAERAGCSPDGTTADGRINPVMRYLADALRFYMEFHGRYDGFYGAFVHDPFAVAAALDPGLVRTEALPVDVELGGTLTTGETVTDWRRAWGRPPTLDVALEGDAAAFFERFIERVGGLAARMG